MFCSVGQPSNIIQPKNLRAKITIAPGGKCGILTARFLKLLLNGTVDVVYTWKYGGPHILITICANEMKLCVYNAYVL